MTKQLKQQGAVAHETLEAKELAIKKLLDEMKQLQRRIGDHGRVLWDIEERHELGLIDKTNPIHVTEAKKAKQEISTLKTKFSKLQSQYEALQWPIWNQEMREFYESEIKELRAKINSHEQALLGPLAKDAKFANQTQCVIDDLRRELRELSQSLEMWDSLGGKR